MADTASANISTNAWLTATGDGMSITAAIDFGGDFDWYRTSLQSGYGYQIWVEGSYFGLGTLGDPYLRVYDTGGSRLWVSNGPLGDESQRAWAPSYGTPANVHGNYYHYLYGVVPDSFLYFAPAYSGTYFLSAEAWSLSATGSYTITVRRDELDNTSSVATISTGYSATGQLGNGTLDTSDWHRVSLSANTNYRFDLIDRFDASGSEQNLTLRLRDANGNLVLLDEGSGFGDNDSLAFTPSAAGTYFLDVREETFVAGWDQHYQLYSHVGFSAGKVQLLADFARGAYALQAWENPFGNDERTGAVRTEDLATLASLRREWSPVELTLSGVPQHSVSDFVTWTNGMSSGGFYTNENAAAFVARRGDVLVVAFRGTNHVTDESDWINMSAHYELLRPLVEALEQYIDQPTNGIREVWVTGHSLGGSMAIKFMDDHPSPIYSAVTFAAPGYDFWGTYDERMLLLEIDGDVVPDLRTSNGSHDNGPAIHFDTHVLSGLHAMDLYRQVADSISTDEWTTALRDLDTAYETGMEVGRLQLSGRSINLTVGDIARTITPAQLDSVIELYIAYINRVPDADGMVYWINQLKAGKTLAQIGESFYSAAVQYAGLTGYSAGMDPEDFVRVVYRNVLGRDNPDAEGLAYWGSALAKGTATYGTLVSAILDSAHTFKGNAQYGYVADLLDNKIMVGKAFAISYGLVFDSPGETISNGMAIAAAVTSTSIEAALELMGIPGDFSLY